MDFLKKYDLDNVHKIKITDSKTGTILFNSDVILHDKIDWSLDGYSQEYRYHFTENLSSIFFVTDKNTGLIKIMSLDTVYNTHYDSIFIQYKADEKNKSSNLYKLDLTYKSKL